MSLYISLELHAQVGDQDLVEAISGALMSVWKIRRFSESRWLTIGSSCRVLIAGLVTGLDNFARFIQRDSAHLNTFPFCLIHLHLPTQKGSCLPPQYVAPQQLVVRWEVFGRAGSVVCCYTRSPRRHRAPNFTSMVSIDLGQQREHSLLQLPSLHGCQSQCRWSL